MDERSDAFLALPGGIGTLEELVEVWTARSLNMHHKPVVVLDPWGDYDHLHALLDHWVTQGFVRQGAMEHVHWATDTEAALDEIQRAWSPDPATEADGKPTPPLPSPASRDGMTP
jgi:uncharacterized protein (TIGR00730 family)